MNVLKEFASLIKLRLVSLTVLTGLTGYVAAVGGFSFRLVFFCLGLFLMAAGSAALNQYQERHLDKLMERTRNRPLASGRMSAAVGLAVVSVFILGGLAILWPVFGPVPAVLGIAAVIVYNGIYIYLKRVTAFAVLTGALVGILPPGMGWTAGGGSVFSPALAALMFFFYLWQAPHFWLLLGIHAEDYRKAGFPTLSELLTVNRFARVIFIWIIASGAAVLLFPLTGLVNHTASLILLAGVILWIGIDALPLLKKNQDILAVFKREFLHVNLFALAIMVILIIDHGIIK
jgi:protoheme IX farnesyltransferase